MAWQGKPKRGRRNRATGKEETMKKKTMPKTVTTRQAQFEDAVLFRGVCLLPTILPDEHQAARQSKERNRPDDDRQPEATWRRPTIWSKSSTSTNVGLPSKPEMPPMT
jgi:hypothetical protein